MFTFLYVLYIPTSVKLAGSLRYQTHLSTSGNTSCGLPRALQHSPTLRRKVKERESLGKRVAIKIFSDTILSLAQERTFVIKKQNLSDIERNSVSRLSKLLMLLLRLPTTVSPLRSQKQEASPFIFEALVIATDHPSQTRVRSFKSSMHEACFFYLTNFYKHLHLYFLVIWQTS